MKICHVTSAHNSTDGRIFYKECTTLAKFGHDVTLVACGDSREENGVHVIGVGKKPNSRIKRMLNFTNKIYKAALSVDADAYHLHDPELLPYVKKLQRKKKKVIFDSHENTLEQMYEKEWIPKFLRNFVGNRYKKYATKVFRKVDALISVTPYIVDMLRDINRNAFLITNYPIVDETCELPCREVKSENFSLCFTGGISRAWSHETIIDCIDKIPSCQYILCGKADEEYLNGLKKLHGWNKVDYRGVVSKGEAFKIQNSANIGMALLIPSKNTNGIKGTIGNTKIFEYMLAGIPIICTRFDLWREIVEEYECGICVDPSKSIEIIEAIEYMKAHTDEAMRMGMNGFRLAKEKYNWHSQEKTLNKIYASMEVSI